MLLNRHVGNTLVNKYGPGNGEIWLSDLVCSGTETSLVDCDHFGWTHDVDTCIHDKDVSIECA